MFGCWSLPLPALLWLVVDIQVNDKVKIRTRGRQFKLKKEFWFDKGISKTWRANRSSDLRDDCGNTGISKNQVRLENI